MSNQDPKNMQRTPLLNRPIPQILVQGWIGKPLRVQTDKLNPRRKEG
jgi:hypothetical protein